MAASPQLSIAERLASQEISQPYLSRVTNVRCKLASPKSTEAITAKPSPKLDTNRKQAGLNLGPLNTTE
ncbi:hypothetical protein DdX_20655 [Ditylenchus destructor]|uniref:Uncharacterized protein n=1 Tax=Ditylenchus destructor TaxID=166010 RepID=A0AAD4QTH6_9BILA|nr:hypothetical protein DdX_20655 [Ditylenchus destructor]